jgi:rhodanese-related sulfurtransferase
MTLPGYLWWLPFGSVPDISPAELRAWLDEGRPLQLVDARSGAEYRGGTIGKATHAPVTAMPASMARQSLDKEIPVVVLCLSGHRSLPGTRWLRARGYEAYSLRGGFLAWRKAGYGLG